MSINYYKDNILEKAASSFIQKPLQFGANIVADNSTALGLGGLGAGALAGAYAVSDEADRERIRNLSKTMANGAIDANVYGTLQSMGRYGGGMIGAGLALKKKKSMKDVANSAMAGMAIGDIAGATTLPTAALFKRHRAEFGTNPDMKSVGKVMAANVLPTAGIWGGLYGLKQGRKIKSKITKGLAEGGETIRNATKEYSSDLKNNDIGKLTKGIAAGAAGIGTAFVPMELMDQISGVPTYVVTPRNIVNAKKKKLERQNLEVEP